MHLKTLRRRIDQIDYEILRLLNKRIELALRTKKFKSVVYNKKREIKILEQLKKYSNVLSLIQAEFVEKLFKKIIEENRKLQEAKRKLIGFQGEHGAFGEIAAGYYDSNLIPIPYPHFADVFEEVENGNLDLGIVPVENSLGGAIDQVNELLIKTDLKIVAALKMRINHCLLAMPGSNYEEIKVVYSHSQALSQCRDFLNKHNLEGHPFYDTAGAARMLAKEKPKMAAAIASKLCGKIYNLEVIKENIEDIPSNFTRFLILSKDEKKEPANKCSIIFSTPHRAGALFEALKIFAEAGINLTRIESLPYRDDPGSYIFFIDFQRKAYNKNIDKIFKKMKDKTKIFKCLGCYQEKVFQ